ncbi:MBL fold metallo-hydrolase [Pseudomonas batumici]|uniref:ComEC/Rec2 family competence protein n=1 Tax=Pseudomonas batumici TaxID=226910 RepID=UPI0030CFE640
MAWSLEIHHIDVRTSGDATLIVARNPNNPAGERVRSVLIDGGHQDAADDVHAYVIKAGLASVDAMVATHYDSDHLGGLVALLERDVTTYDNVRIYDRGWPALGPDSLYQKYLRAINLGPDRRRITRAVKAADVSPGILLSMVNRDGSPAIPPGDSAFQVTRAINQAPQWLIDSDQAEILQATGAHAPTLTCIACNQWVKRHGQASFRAPAGLGDAENATSLAFLLRFGDFSYYIGGDIEDPQEALIGTFANPADNAAGRVLVVKASHHGASTASSAEFLQRMRPLAVMVSNGTDNQHRHPAAATVNVLNGYARNDGAVLPPLPPSPIYRPRRSYFTGYDTDENMENHFVTLGQVAGDPNSRRHPGHVRVDVSETQAVNNRNFPGSAYRGVQAVAAIAARARDGSDIADRARAAAEAAVKGTLVDTVRALVDTQASRDMANALWTLRCKTAGGVKSDYIANMSAMPSDLEAWRDVIDEQEKQLPKAGNQQQVYQCAAAAVQVAAAANAAFPGVLAGLSALPASIDGLAAAYTLVNARVPMGPYAAAAQAATDAAAQARDILNNRAARITTLATNAANTAQQIRAAGSEEQAKTLAAQAISLAEQACVGTGEAVDDLALCYTRPALAAPNPSPQLVAHALTLACGGTALGVAAGAAAGALCGNGKLETSVEALRVALGTVNIDPAAAITALREALSGGEPLFTVRYYKASANKDVQDNLS